MIIVLQLVGLWPRENLEFSNLTLFLFFDYWFNGFVHISI